MWRFCVLRPEIKIKGGKKRKLPLLMTFYDLLFFIIKSSMPTCKCKLCKQENARNSYLIQRYKTLVWLSCLARLQGTFLEMSWKVWQKATASWPVFPQVYKGLWRNLANHHQESIPSLPSLQAGGNLNACCIWLITQTLDMPDLEISDAYTTVYNVDSETWSQKRTEIWLDNDSTVKWTRL